MSQMEAEKTRTDEAEPEAAGSAAKMHDTDVTAEGHETARTPPVTGIKVRTDFLNTVLNDIGLSQKGLNTLINHGFRDMNALNAIEEGDLGLFEFATADKFVLRSYVRRNGHKNTHSEPAMQRETKEERSGAPGLGSKLTPDSEIRSGMSAESIGWPALAERLLAGAQPGPGVGARARVSAVALGAAGPNNAEQAGGANAEAAGGRGMAIAGAAAAGQRRDDAVAGKQHGAPPSGSDPSHSAPSECHGQQNNNNVGLDAVASLLTGLLSDGDMSHRSPQPNDASVNGACKWVKEPNDSKVKAWDLSSFVQGNKVFGGENIGNGHAHGSDSRSATAASGSACGESETVVSTLNSGGQLVFKASASKQRLGNLTMSQWCAANCRIIKELVEKPGVGGTHHVLAKYTDYVTKTCELVEVYEWPSVLQYDQAFRSKVQQGVMDWGDTCTHLDRLHLRIRKQGGPSQTQKPGYAGKRHTGPDRQMHPHIQCRNFNEGVCSFNPCKFSHTCTYPNCGKNHPLFDHDKQTSKSGKNY